MLNYNRTAVMWVLHVKKYKNKNIKNTLDTICNTILEISDTDEPIYFVCNFVCNFVYLYVEI